MGGRRGNAKLDTHVVGAILLSVRRIRLPKVDIGKEPRQHCYDVSPHRKADIDKTIINERRQATIHEERPRLLGSGDVRITVKRDIDECVPVEEGDEVVEAA